MPLELKPQGIYRVLSNNRDNRDNRADCSEAVSNFTIKFTASVEGESTGFLALLKRFPDEVEK